MNIQDLLVNNEVRNRTIAEDSFNETIKGIKFCNVAFDECKFRIGGFKDCEFIGCSFNDCRFLGPNFEKCTFDGCSFYHIRDNDSITLDSCDLVDVYFRSNRAVIEAYHSRLNRVRFNHMRLSSSRFIDSEFVDCEMKGTNLSNVTFLNVKGLETTDFDESTAFFSLQCPEEGSFIAWKSCQNNKIVKLEIPAEAKRSSSTSRKCRAEFAKVLGIYEHDRTLSKAQEARSFNDGSIYKVGEMFYPDKFDEDRWNECSNGVHFFITFEEALSYAK